MAVKKKVLFIVEAMGSGVFQYIVDFDKCIYLIEVKNFECAINPIKDVKAFFEIRKIANEVNPDVIHLHSSKASVLGWWAFNGKNAPMFYTPHGYSFLMENYKPMKLAMFKTIESICAKRNCTTISCNLSEHQESLKLTKRAAYVNNGINVAELQQMIDETERMKHPFTVFTLFGNCGVIWSTGEFLDSIRVYAA